MRRGLLEFWFRAQGHKNIRATHPTTLEITKEPYVSLRGDCIVAVNAEASVNDLGDELKSAIKRGAEVLVELEVDGLKEVVRGFGHPKLSLSHNKSMVIRKSNFTCARTLAIKADKAARDLSRDFVRLLRTATIVEVCIKVRLLP